MHWKGESCVQGASICIILLYLEISAEFSTRNEPFEASIYTMASRQTLLGTEDEGVISWCDLLIGLGSFRREISTAVAAE